MSEAIDPIDDPIKLIEAIEKQLKSLKNRLAGQLGGKIAADHTKDTLEPTEKMLDEVKKIEAYLKKLKEIL